MPEFTRQEGDVILSGWLKTDARQLTDFQRNHILTAFETTKSPLFLRLCFDLSKKWKSYTPETDLHLPNTIQALIDVKIAVLERTHGRVFVERALTYITSSRDGLSTTELEDVMSLDEAALDDVFQYWVPPIRRMPPLLWVRARRDLGEYLLETTSRGTSTLRWAHRQFVKMVRRRYLGYNESDVETSVEDLGTLINDKQKRLVALVVEEPVEEVGMCTRNQPLLLSRVLLCVVERTNYPQTRSIISVSMCGVDW